MKKALLLICLLCVLPLGVSAMDRMSDSELDKVTGKFADVPGLASFLARPITEVVPVAGLAGYAAAPAVEAYWWYDNSPTLTEPIRMVTDTVKFSGVITSAGFGGF